MGLTDHERVLKIEVPGLEEVLDDLYYLLGNQRTLISSLEQRCENLETQLGMDQEWNHEWDSEEHY